MRTPRTPQLNVPEHRVAGASSDVGSGTITDGGHNLDNGTACGFSAANGSLSNANPLLDPAGLANNGGPTQTIALRASSPALDHGDPAVCAAPPVNNVDQRGFPRRNPYDPICDIGAFEVQRAGLAAPVMSPAGLRVKRLLG